MSVTWSACGGGFVAEQPGVHEMRFWTILARSLLLRCPACGRGKLFRGWFKMHERCANCELDFLPEPGYYLGSIYFNYFVTALLVTFIFFGLYFAADVDPGVMLWPLAAFCVIFPLWFFRYARALWRGFDELFDPGQGRKEETSGEVPKA